MANGTINNSNLLPGSVRPQAEPFRLPVAGSLLATGYAGTVFLGAFLLFLVQPLLGKFILPWFGGSPAVWTTAMLVFQVLLFGGYLYAHVVSRLPLPWQAGLHSLLLLSALGTLPIAPGPEWKPLASEAPALRIVWLLTACVGLPYLLLSATGPLVQSWHGRTHQGRSPYRLYALSNVGSLLALVAYPFAFERMFAKTAQAEVWSWTFALFAVLCGACSWLAWRFAGSAPRTEPMATGEVSTGAVGLDRMLLWFGLAATASVLLLAVTNQVCVDVAVVPFLWVIPLGLYLLTFILCFDSDRWYRRAWFTVPAVALLVMSCLLAVTGGSGSLVQQLLVYLGALFTGCMVCHGELVALKPHPRHLTLFYLTISAGGAFGGVFVALLAPMIFAGYHELYLGSLAFVLLLGVVLTSGATQIRPATALMAAGGVLVLGGLGLSYYGPRLPGTVAVSRNFYGVLKVEAGRNSDTNEAQVSLVHGGVLHGVQFATSEKRRWPTAYYGRSSGVGRLLTVEASAAPRHVGVVGLGVGTLSTYGRAEDRLRLYEINPDVVTLARRHFTFLKDCPSEQNVILGDARLELEREAPQDFDVLVLDAFSGDAIPVHLLTREAIEVYLRHLKPDGVLAFHITNIHFDLRPVLAGLAEEFGLAHTVVVSDGQPKRGTFVSMWGLMSRNPTQLPKAREGEPAFASDRSPLLWTDDRNNLFEVLSHGLTLRLAEAVASSQNETP